MRYFTWPWQMIVTALAEYWRREVTPKKNPSQLTPIRYSGDPRGIYLA
jgi:hypothetical protein